MDKKVFLAVGLCAAIFLLWQKVYLNPLAQQRQAQVQQQAPLHAAPANDSADSAKTVLSVVTKGPETKVVTLGTANYSAMVSTARGVVVGVQMPEFRGQKAETLAQLVGGSEQLELTAPSQEWNDYFARVIYSVRSEAPDRLILVHDSDKATIERTYVLNAAQFSIDHDIAITFKVPPPAYLFVGLRSAIHLPKNLQENERREVHFKKVGGHETWIIDKFDELHEDLGEGQWAAVSSRYFLSALIDRGASIKPQFQGRPAGSGEVMASLIYKIQGQSARIPQRFYVGPKDTDVLKKLGDGLQAAVDFGWFTIFAIPMLSALKWFYHYVNNYGVAIILLTLLVKLITYPLTFKSMKSMKEMQRIQPQLAKLREKYADDKEKLNREMLQLMRANGYNPMSGCLPILIQMPIFMALYNVLYGAIDLYGQPFFGWIHNLSDKDPYYVMPVLLAGMMFIQQRMTPNTATDPMQQRMMMMMPLVFGVMMLWLPAGLTLYMLINSVTSILQQVVINRSLGLGKDSGAPAAA